MLLILILFSVLLRSALKLLVGRVRQKGHPVCKNSAAIPKAIRWKPSLNSA